MPGVAVLSAGEPRTPQRFRLAHSDGGGTAAIDGGGNDGHGRPDGGAALTAPSAWHRFEVGAASKVSESHFLPLAEYRFRDPARGARRRRSYIRTRMQIMRREHIKWTVPPGLILALMVSLSRVIVRWVHVDPHFPLLDHIECPLRSIQRGIWPRQSTFYTPYTTIIYNGPPDWLASVPFWDWWILVPFAFGAWIGEVVRFTVARFSRNHTG